MSSSARLEGPPLSIADLESSFGPVAGAVMGYGSGEIGPDGRLRWCAAVLPGTAMNSFLNSRAKTMKATGADHRRPFLLAMGTLQAAAARGGVPRALYGVALAYPGNQSASDILHDEQLRRPVNLNNGVFRWPTGVPFLRAWLCEPPVPFQQIIGSEHRVFGSSDGNRVVPLDELVPGLSSAIGTAVVREIALDKPETWPVAVAKAEKRYREGHLKRQPERLVSVRSREARNDALAGNLERYGAYTCENPSCGYRAADDAAISNENHAGMYDVHHRVYIARGERETEVSDLVVLCPRCHRREHLEHFSEASNEPTAPSR